MERSLAKTERPSGPSGYSIGISLGEGFSELLKQGTIYGAAVSMKNTHDPTHGNLAKTRSTPRLT
jgi:hypothetical protein